LRNWQLQFPPFCGGLSIAIPLARIAVYTWALRRAICALIVFADCIVVSLMMIAPPPCHAPHSINHSPSTPTSPLVAMIASTRIRGQTYTYILDILTGTQSHNGLAAIFPHSTPSLISWQFYRFLNWHKLIEKIVFVHSELAVTLQNCISKVAKLVSTHFLNFWGKWFMISILYPCRGFYDFSQRIKRGPFWLYKVCIFFPFICPFLRKLTSQF